MISGMASVIILNYNKKDLLKQCVASVLTLDWPELEVIVVDNASSDGSAEMVVKEYQDQVHLIQRRTNCPVAARNDGFRRAQGEYILSLDGDMVLPERDLINRAVSLFKRFPHVGILALKVCTLQNPQQPLPEHWWHPVDLDAGKDHFFYTDFFSEGGVFIRAKAIATIGEYDEEFFRYFEGTDLALRFLRGGYDILYCPTLTCAELNVRGFLYSQRTSGHYLALRNKLWIAWKHYPLWRGVLFSMPRIAVGAFRAARYGWTDYFWAALRDGIFAPPPIRQRRRPLGRQIWKKIDKIRQGKSRPDTAAL